MTTIRAIASTMLFASFGLAQAPPSATLGALELRNAPLASVIDGLVRQLGINVVLDTRVATGVSVTTYGDSRGADARDVLDLILQSSGATMLETVGDGDAKGPVSRIIQRTLGPGGRDQTSLHLVFEKDMPANTWAQLIRRLASQEPVEVVRNSSSSLLMIRSTPSIR
ncbi:MAG TPA: hypothetical protein VN841_07950 [Bryobacteraceae bacterium]|nr:hypothetical protein [Bryobacteraceae bacterium]